MAIIIAKYRGWCVSRCGVDIAKGDKIVYRGRGNTWHVDCYDKTGEVTGVYGDVTGATTGICEPRRVHSVDPGNAAEIALARRETARDNSEYQKGIQDVANWQENKRMFGEEEAERMEIEKELRDGWDY